VNAVGTGYELVSFVGGDAVTGNNLNQFANVDHIIGANLAINESTTLNGGTHSGTNTGDQDLNALTRAYADGSLVIPQVLTITGITSPAGHTNLVLNRGLDDPATKSPTWADSTGKWTAFIQNGNWTIKGLLVPGSQFTLGNFFAQEYGAIYTSNLPTDVPGGMYTGVPGNPGMWLVTNGTAVAINVAGTFTVGTFKGQWLRWETAVAGVYDWYQWDGTEWIFVRKDDDDNNDCLTRTIAQLTGVELSYPITDPYPALLVPTQYGNEGKTSWNYFDIDEPDQINIYWSATPSASWNVTAANDNTYYHFRAPSSANDPFSIPAADWKRVTGGTNGGYAAPGWSVIPLEFTQGEYIGQWMRIGDAAPYDWHQWDGAEWIFVRKDAPIDLAGAAAELSVSGVYYDMYTSATKTVTFLGTPINGSTISLWFENTVQLTMTIPISNRIGEAGSIDTIVFPIGNHTIKWVYMNSKWYVSDSAWV
jgi:hypothetical protein